MPLQIDTLEDRVDITRLIEDLSATMPLYRSAAQAGRALHPSTALLQHLGEAYLDTGPLLRSVTVRRASGFPAIVDSFLVPAFGGSVRLSYLLMAFALGRPGLRKHLLRHGEYDWSACLRWLVLHGVHEMHLWPYLSENFVRELRTPSLLIESKRLSPLQALVIAERPDVLAAFRNQASPLHFTRYFTEWFLDRGVAEYGHAWLMSADEVAFKTRQDRTGTWTAGPTVDEIAENRALLDRIVFPDQPIEPPSPASQARATARTHYRLYGSHFPCAFLDMSNADAALSAVVTGEARPALRGGLDLLSPFIELRLPGGRDSTALVKLDLAVPEPLRPDLSVRFRVRDGLGSLRFERRVSAQALGSGPLVIPVILRDLSPRLEIAFALGGRPPAPGPDLVTTFAVMRTLRVWQVIAEANGNSILPAEAA